MCGAGPNAGSATVVDPAAATLVEGVVLRDGVGVDHAYVRLLDGSGEFTAEVPTAAGGEFRFFAGPGRWTVRALAPGAAPAERQVVAERGATVRVEVVLGG
jgi:hypothetical protein